MAESNNVLSWLAIVVPVAVIVIVAAWRQSNRLSFIEGSVKTELMKNTRVLEMLNQTVGDMRQDMLTKSDLSNLATKDVLSHIQDDLHIIKEAPPTKRSVQRLALKPACSDPHATSWGKAVVRGVSD